MEHTVNIIYDGISLEVTGINHEPEQETGFKGGFGAKYIILIDHLGNEQNVFSWFGNKQIEEINRLAVYEI